MLLLYFGSNSCGVCRGIRPKLEQMLKKYPAIQAVEVDEQNLPELSASYCVFTIPVILLFIQGKETIREAGIISLSSLEQRISRYYELFYGSD